MGNLKGVGKVYQLTAIDVFTRWATVAIVLGPVSATHTIRFLDQVLKHYRRLGVGVRAVLTDNGPEYVASGFRAHLATKNLTHVRIPPRSPNHNSVCERFHGTILQESWRPAFHRRHFTYPPASGRSRCLAHPLQPPEEEPRRLHAGPDPKAVLDSFKQIKAA